MLSASPQPFGKLDHSQWDQGNVHFSNGPKKRMVARKAFPMGRGQGTGDSLTPTFGHSSHGGQALNVLSINLLLSEQGCSEASLQAQG